LSPLNNPQGLPLTGGKNNADFSNSPETMLAIASLMKPKANKKGKIESKISFKKLQEELKEKFGIESELTKVDGQTTLKFANGDFISDTNGNGVLEMKELGMADKFAGMQAGAGFGPQAFNPISQSQFGAQQGDEFKNPFGGDSFNIFGDYGDDKKKSADGTTIQQPNPYQKMQQQFMKMMQMFCMCQAFTQPPKV